MEQRIGNDPVTAYGLARQDDGTVLISEMMRIWNTIDPQKKYGIDDLPEHMQREDNRIVSEVDHPPIRLDIESVLQESFRLSGEFRAPDEDGWYNASNLVRVAKSIGMYSDLDGKKSGADIVSLFHNHPLIENKLVRDSLYFRPRINGPEPIPQPVKTSVLCLGEADPRQLDEQVTFGAAYRAVLAMSHDLVSDGTRLVFERGEDTRTASFHARDKAWIMADGTRMKRTDPDDPLLHHYDNGQYVGGLVGFVSFSHRGRIFANIGIPIDSPGDDDAVISIKERREFAVTDEAFTALADRKDLDRVFTCPVEHSTMMGFWLTCMKDADV